MAADTRCRYLGSAPTSEMRKSYCWWGATLPVNRRPQNGQNRHVPKRIVIPKLTSAERATFRVKREAFERDRAAERAAEKAAAEAQGKKGKPPREVCKACLRAVSVRASSPTGLQAHQRPNGRWCGGGAKPSEAQRNGTAKGKSVHTVSGGLPGLGKG